MPDSRRSAVLALNSSSASPGANTPPMAVDDQAETTLGTPVLIDVLANDHDPDGDPLQITALTMPGHGTVALVSPGTIRYVPQAGFSGIDYFSYTIRDGRKGHSTAWVEVHVRAANTAPLARADSITTTRGQPVTFDVLANDNDPDGDKLTVTGFSLPTSGQLAFNADRTFTYTPGPGFVGEDGFVYSISDGRGGTAQAEVTLVVAWPNQAPVTVDDRATTPQGMPVTIDVLTNDSDADDDPLRLVALTMPLNGLLAVNPDQSITYSPDATFSGVDEFTYTIADGRGGRNSAVVVIEVVTANRAPSDILLDNLTVLEKLPRAVVGRVTVLDPDVGDSHALEVDDPGFEVVQGMLKLADGVMLDHATEPLVAISITATDTGGLTLTRRFSIAVVDVNEAPTDILLDNLTVLEKLPGAVVGRVTVLDPDAGDNHTLEVDDPRFEVVQGMLKLADGVMLDHAAEPLVAISIAATDMGGLSLTQNFTNSIVAVGAVPGRNGALLTSAGDRLVASNGNTLTHEEAA